MHTNTLITTSFLLTLCVGVKGALSESLNEPHLSTRRDLASLRWVDVEPQELTTA